MEPTVKCQNFPPSYPCVRPRSLGQARPYLTPAAASMALRPAVGSALTTRCPITDHNLPKSGVLLHLNLLSIFSILLHHGLNVSVQISVVFAVCYRCLRSSASASIHANYFSGIEAVQGFNVI